MGDYKDYIGIARASLDPTDENQERILDLLGLPKGAKISEIELHYTDSSENNTDCTKPSMKVSFSTSGGTSHFKEFSDVKASDIFEDMTVTLRPA